MGKVSVDDKMRIQTLREQGLGYRAIARNTQRKTESWTLLSLSVNVSMKWDQLSPENQAEVDPGEWPPNSPDLLIRCLGSYAWTLQDISTQAK